MFTEWKKLTVNVVQRHCCNFKIPEDHTINFNILVIVTVDSCDVSTKQTIVTWFRSLYTADIYKRPSQIIQLTMMTRQT